MARISFHPLINGLSKSLGRLTMSSWRGISYVTQKRKPKNPRTPRQQENRMRFAVLVHGWQSLPADARGAWNRAAEGRPLSGYNLFLRENHTRISRGAELLESPFMDDGPCRAPSTSEPACANTPGRTTGTVRRDSDELLSLEKPRGLVHPGYEEIRAPEHGIGQVMPVDLPPRSGRPVELRQKRRAADAAD
jgi:hypothetical protein